MKGDVVEEIRIAVLSALVQASHRGKIPEIPINEAGELTPHFTEIEVGNLWSFAAAANQRGLHIIGHVLHSANPGMFFVTLSVSATGVDKLWQHTAEIDTSAVFSTAMNIVADTFDDTEKGID